MVRRYLSPTVTSRYGYGPGALFFDQTSRTPAPPPVNEIPSDSLAAIASGSVGQPAPSASGMIGGGGGGGGYSAPVSGSGSIADGLSEAADQIGGVVSGFAPSVSPAGTFDPGLVGFAVGMVPALGGVLSGINTARNRSIATEEANQALSEAGFTNPEADFDAALSGLASFGLGFAADALGVGSLSAEDVQGEMADAALGAVQARSQALGFPTSQVPGVVAPAVSLDTLAKQTQMATQQALSRLGLEDPIAEAKMSSAGSLAPGATASPGLAALGIVAGSMNDDFGTPAYASLEDMTQTMNLAKQMNMPFATPATLQKEMDRREEARAQESAAEDAAAASAAAAQSAAAGQVSVNDQTGPQGEVDAVAAAEAEAEAAAAEAAQAAAAESAAAEAADAAAAADSKGDPGGNSGDGGGASGPGGGGSSAGAGPAAGSIGNPGGHGDPSDGLGWAKGGYVDIDDGYVRDEESPLNEIAERGRFGDTMLAHITPEEAELLIALGGSGSINPETGLPEFFSFSDFLGPVGGGIAGHLVGGPIGAAVGAAAGSWLSDSEIDPVTSALAGYGLSAASPLVTGGDFIGFEEAGTRLMSGLGDVGAAIGLGGGASAAGAATETAAQSAAPAAEAASNAASGSGGFFSGVGDFVKENPIATAAGVLGALALGSGIGEQEPARRRGYRPDQQEMEALPPQQFATPREYQRPKASIYKYGIQPEQGFTFFTPVNPTETIPDYDAVPQYAEGGPVENGGGALQAAANGRYYEGPGGGQDDMIPARLSDGEYVIPADVVAHLGDGSADAGADAIEEMIANVRTHKTGAGADHPPMARSPLAYMKGAA